MPNLRLTEATARACKPPTDRPWIIVWDSDLSAFGLRITRNGVRTFVLDFSSNGRKRRMAIGQMPQWTVKAARTRAEELKREAEIARADLDLCKFEPRQENERLLARLRIEAAL